MCGIVGLMSPSSEKSLAQEILGGLERLEYRGYDSAGISLASEAGVRTFRRAGRVAELRGEAGLLERGARMGIGHTRWATHGRPSERNAHPQSDGRISLAHNGIVENHLALRAELGARPWASDTDTEVVLALLQREWPEGSGPGFEQALLSVGRRLQGRSAFVAMAQDEPDTLFALQLGAPIVIGLRRDGVFMVASDTLAFSAVAGGCVGAWRMPEGSVARVRAREVTAWTLGGEALECRLEPVRAEDEGELAPGAPAHHMHREIHEQDRVIERLLGEAVDRERLEVQEPWGVGGLNLGKVSHIHIVGCGSAFHAGLLGKRSLEQMTRLPVTAELASEARSSDQAWTPKTLLIALSQSGETADTVACAERAAGSGCQILAFSSRSDSSLGRLATKTIELRCGREVSVAATKTFTSMALCLQLFALACGANRGLLRRDALRQRLVEALELPRRIREALGREEEIAAVARKHAAARSALFIGRRWLHPVALEGALKLKEVSYVHAEGLAAGELKHGTLALVDEALPVIALAPRDSQHAKMISSVTEVAARGGRIVGFGDEEDGELRALCEDFVGLPRVPEALGPIVAGVALQLLAYHSALARGTEVDRPRNLAKSVTVE